MQRRGIIPKYGFASVVACLVWLGGTVWAVSPPRALLGEDALLSGGGSAVSARFSVTASLGDFAQAAESSDPRICTEPVLLNDPPLPQKDLILMPSNAPVTIRIADLLANDLDLESDFMSLALTSSNTLRGGTVTLSGQTIIYTPPMQPTGAGSDSFSYLITDGYGATTLSRVVLALAASAPQITGVTRDQTGLNMSFRGVPGTLYQLQFRRDWNAASVWRDYPDETQPLIQRAGSDGLYQFTSAINIPQAYFRAVAIESLTELPGVVRSGDRLTMNFRGIPLETYKLQFRSRFDPSAPWTDYPSTTQPLVQQADRDGEYLLSVPIGAGTGFFRSVLRDP
jgi:hypothetical protein